MNTQTPPATELDFRNSALSWLQQHENGEILRQLGEQLMGAVRAVETHPGAKSAACLTLKIAIRRVENKNLLEVGHDLAVKLPKQPNTTALFWGNGTGQLLQNNPRQRDLSFPDEPAPRADLAAHDGFTVRAPLAR